jgi:hypothetical protein
MGYPTLSAHTGPRRSIQAVLAGFLFSHFAKTRVTRPYKTRSEKHPNLPRHCGNGNSVALPLILSESRASHGQSAPYCLFAPTGGPCRRGPLDLAIETASNYMARLDCTGRQDNSALGVRHWQHNVALSGSIPLQPASSFVQAGGTWIAQRSEFASSDGLWQVEGIAAEHIDVF